MSGPLADAIVRGDPARPGTADPALVVRHLSVGYERRGGDRFDALRDVSLEVAAGETLGIAGESGSGKSTLGLAVLGLLPPAARSEGDVTIAGGDGAEARGSRRRWNRALISQEAIGALNPALRIGAQMSRLLRRNQQLSRAAASAAAIEWLERVEIKDPAAVLRRYPHELSGGMCQRVNIAMALSCEPRLLVADEPTSALDVAVQRQVIQLLKGIAKEEGAATLLISHDLGVLGEAADRIVVMVRGTVIEEGRTTEVLHHPRHPYTKALVAAVPSLDHPGTPVSEFDPSAPTPPAFAGGCRYAAACPERFAPCAIEPPLVAAGASTVRCWLAVPESERPEKLAVPEPERPEKEHQ